MHRKQRICWLLLVMFATGCCKQSVHSDADLLRLRRAARIELPATLPDPVDPPNPPKNVLVLSGGGMYGAYTAGFLAGWTSAGTRPVFDVVTGVSTGSLIACAAFLGPNFDATAREFYTSVTASDIYSNRSWVMIPWSDSLASSKPLKRLIGTVIDEPFLKAIAIEHRRGRRLYVGTTQLSTRKQVVWDMGAIAELGDLRLFQDVLLASCSVPGMLPPVQLPDRIHCPTKKEWHSDGGITAPLFVPQGVLANAPDGKPSGTNLFVLIAGKLFPDPRNLRPRVLTVLEASATGIVYAHTRSEIASLFHMSRLTGGQFHLTALPDSDGGEPLGLSFEPREMSRLYEVGYFHGIGGPVWMTAPPFESSATDPPRK